MPATRPRPSHPALGFALALVLLLAACGGGSDDDATPTTSAAPSSTSAATSSTAGDPDGSTTTTAARVGFDEAVAALGDAAKSSTDVCELSGVLARFGNVAPAETREDVQSLVLTAVAVIDKLAELAPPGNEEASRVLTEGGKALFAAAGTNDFSPEWLAGSPEELRSEALGSALAAITEDC